MQWVELASRGTQKKPPPGGSNAGGWGPERRGRGTTEGQAPFSFIPLLSAPPWFHNQISIPFDYKNAWELKAGFEYKINDKLALRGGYMYTENNVPDITLNPGNPASNQHGVTLGFGYKMGRFTFDAFCLGDFYENRKVSNQILSGEYQSFMLIVGSSVNFKWK